jgi:hypothetical protein
MNLKPQQFIGTDLPEGQRSKSVVECFGFLNRPGARETLQTAMRADGTGDYKHGMAVLEMVRGGDAGHNIEADNKFAEKVMKEKERLAYGKQ